VKDFYDENYTTPKKETEDTRMWKESRVHGSGELIQ
jgi:hypothetical protein